MSRSRKGKCVGAVDFFFTCITIGAHRNRAHACSVTACVAVRVRVTYNSIKAHNARSHMRASATAHRSVVILTDRHVDRHVLSSLFLLQCLAGLVSSAASTSSFPVDLMHACVGTYFFGPGYRGSS